MTLKFKRLQSEWRQLTCSSLELLENCKINKAGDHRVTSTCLLRMDRLTLSGSYKCLAVDKNSNNQLAAGYVTVNSIDAFRAEAALSVIGIANVTVVESSLWHGSSGFVHVQVNIRIVEHERAS